ncbi:MAG: DnaJ domain-containing protein [Chloroflexota bacterium]|nr:DnaJ domain-containing protein [Chloroflexota bacterium]
MPRRRKDQRVPSEAKDLATKSTRATTATTESPEQLPAPSNPMPSSALVPADGIHGPLPRQPADAGLYAVLGLDPAVSDAEIQTAYRRQAARVAGGGGSANATLRQLNAAYEVLGNPVRRAEYDAARSSHVQWPAHAGGGPTHGGMAGAKRASGPMRRRRPRHAVQPRYAGLGDVVVVLVVVVLSLAAGALIVPRLSINLSALTTLQNVGAAGSSRRAIEATVTSAPATRVPTPTVRAGLADRFAGSTVSVSSTTPAQNSTQNVVIRLRRDGQPAANIDVWSTVDYRTISERWPPSGAVKTDANGAATISFNVGQATPGFPVQVHVFAQVEDQQLSWTSSFTPR